MIIKSLLGRGQMMFNRNFQEMDGKALKKSREKCNLFKKKKCI